MRWRLQVAYDGRGYHGWQRQPGVPTVQHVLSDAIMAMNDGRDGRVLGASRTDAGVHALGQCAIFDASVQRPAKAWFHGINQRLPRDVRVRAIDAVDRDYHPGRQATGKIYHYHLWTHPWSNPLVLGRVHDLRRPLNLEAMRMAAAMVLGEHDFSSFRAAGCDNPSPVKLLTGADVSMRDDGRVRVCWEGSGFLKYMIRILTGTLVEIGRGRRPSEWIAEVLEARNRRLAGPTLASEGLTLVTVHCAAVPYGSRGEAWPEREPGIVLP